MSVTSLLSYGAFRPKPGLVLTDCAMRAVAADRPPMGGGFPLRLIKRAACLEIAHSRAGAVFFTLVGPANAILGAVCFHPLDSTLPGPYRAPKKTGATLRGSRLPAVA